MRDDQQPLRARASRPCDTPSAVFRSTRLRCVSARPGIHSSRRWSDLRIRCSGRLTRLTCRLCRGGCDGAPAVLLWRAVRDPAPLASAEQPRGSVLDLLRMPALWPICLMMFAGYGPAASIRGLWAGPFARDLYGAGPEAVGWVTLAMGLAMVAGNFAYGAAPRLLGTRKWAV